MSTVEFIVACLSETQREDILTEKWYFASCDHCGWFGSSKQCRNNPDDDSTCACPKCNEYGIEDGAFALEHQIAILEHLRMLRGGGRKRQRFPQPLPGPDHKI